MSAYTNSDEHSFVRTFSNVSRASARSKTTVDRIDVLQRECLNTTIIEPYGGKKDISIKKQTGKKQCELPYKLAVSVTLEEYEKQPHEVCIHKISKVIESSCRNVEDTPAEICAFGSTRTYADGSAKEADNSFRPEKPEVAYPNGIDKGTRPWPNLVIEVAYSETIDHVTYKVKNYWLKPDRAHDAIVVKIDPVLDDQVPTRMIAWHYCVSDRKTRTTFPARTTFEFGTVDALGAPLTFPQ
ncbi:15570_t:CDS:2, partial [Acaulospora morrowiae]